MDPYCFVEFYDHGSAAAALAAMNKRMCLGRVSGLSVCLYHTEYVGQHGKDEVLEKRGYKITLRFPGVLKVSKIILLHGPRSGGRQEHV